jgi:hypothetical protein
MDAPFDLGWDARACATFYPLPKISPEKLLTKKFL